MNVQNAYNSWASQYDSQENKTRDLEARSLTETLQELTFNRCLEIGCGTGKNTEWLSLRATQVVAIDFSQEMLNKARAKIQCDKVLFLQADLMKNWSFATDPFDLIVFSLVLEHVEELDAVLSKASKALGSAGYVYIGELHPFKQYTGSKARFVTPEGLQILTCFNHHLSDYVAAAKNNGLLIERVAEYFDENDRKAVPRILTLLLKKS
jgi:ubiquinone/menaquinone biosynthesis C-methylase UbiE